MTRARQQAATDAHTRFTAWLLRCAPDEPPRDLALHAAFCPDCRAAIAAFDLLSTVDPGRAPMPPSRPATQPARRGPVSPRLAAAAASLVVIAAGGWALTSGRLSLPLTGGWGSQSPVQQVLGGFGAGEVLTPTPGPTGTVAADPSATETPEPSDAASLEPGATPGPVTTAGPDATGPANPSSPRPTASSRPTRHPSPSPTPVATQQPPSVNPTPQPTPVPSLPVVQCNDLIDNDEDGAIDLLDPQCEGPLDDDEAA